MHFLDRTLPSLAENLALDEALLLAAEQGGAEVLRLWESATAAVVLGAAAEIHKEVHLDACGADGVPIGRRSSGGGTVLLGSGCLIFTLILSYERAAELREIRSSYCYILRRIGDGLKPLVAGVEPAGTSDLAIDGRKVSGNSQQRKREHLLHHGTLLYGFALETIARYLPAPPRQPEYREGRGHAEFLANLPAARDSLAQSLRGLWQADMPLERWPKETTRRLVEEKYARPEWVHRR